MTWSIMCYRDPRLVNIPESLWCIGEYVLNFFQRSWRLEPNRFVCNDEGEKEVFTTPPRGHFFVDSKCLRPILTRECEVWATTEEGVKKLITFERKALRQICSPYCHNGFTEKYEIGYNWRVYIDIQMLLLL